MNDMTPILHGYSDGDVDTNPMQSTHLGELIEQRYSRRQTLVGGASAAVMAVFGGAVLAACDESEAPADSPPIVGAGTVGATASGRMVMLSGTATDNRAVSTVSWTQVSGPPVTLATPNALTTSFIAPSVATATPLVFRLTAVDDFGGSTSADTTVSVGPAQLGFQSISKNRTDIVTVPTGYSVQLGARLGDPIAAGVPAYANNGTDTNFAQRIGDHGDALYWYGLNAAGTRDDNGSTRGLIVQNHENLNEQYLHVNGPTNVAGVRPESEAIKEIEAHGVSVTEYVEGAGRQWSYVQASAFNRRITPNTPMVFNGPVRGSAFLQTVFSPTGVAGRGTVNNCANGHTLWGTNITCEENWAFYFRRDNSGAGTDNAARSARELTALRRNGVTSNVGNFAWSTVVPADSTNTTFRRWDARATGASATDDFRNEPNQFGWCVELDPYDRTQAPRKRTALGRFAHEGAWYGRFIAGQKLAVYLGDDSRGEYLYKFVTAADWLPSDAQRTDRLAVGDKYLDTGTLYVARFNADGTGTWLPLTFGTVPNRPAVGSEPEYVFESQVDILVNTRLAGDAVGATRMDRPEWTATDNSTGEIYLTLTNNNATLRPLTGTDAANPRHYNDPRTSSSGATSNQFGNPNGHILRLREGAGEASATTFNWDVYLFGADSADSNSSVNISGLSANNDFSSPDGLWFARPQNASGLVSPVLWIQTDDGAFTDRTNNQMLAAQPGPATRPVTTQTITNVGSTGATATQTTRVGPPATDATVRRFLVGPIGCEITGVDTTPDGRTLFVGIQHPGESGTVTAPDSSWPTTQATGTAPAGTRPRSAIAIVIKNDGGVVAL